MRQIRLYSNTEHTLDTDDKKGSVGDMLFKLLWVMTYVIVAIEC